MPPSLISSEGVIIGSTTSLVKNVAHELERLREGYTVPSIDTDIVYEKKHLASSALINTDKKSFKVRIRKIRSESAIVSREVVKEGHIEDENQIDDKQSLRDSLCFTPACLIMLQTLPGNDVCIDCGEANPEWASVSYGTLLCLNCSGNHRRLGVQVSFIRSLSMDSWTHSQTLSMLEGGNEQLTKFFDRHLLPRRSRTTQNEDSIRRYKTNAARFYREQLSLHVRKVINGGFYKGRGATRKTTTLTRNENSKAR